MTGTHSEGKSGREGSCDGGVWDGTLYQADRLEITEEGDAASGSGEYAFWITGGCPREGCRVVCRSVRFSSLFALIRTVTLVNETKSEIHLIRHLEYDKSESRLDSMISRCP